MRLMFPVPGMQRLTILCYHAVVPAPLEIPDYCFLHQARFLKQMTWLARSPFRVAPLSLALSDLLAGRIRRPTVALTFDDGFRNNLQVALPILRQFGFPATIFLTTGLVGSRKTTWPCRILHALKITAAETISWGGERLELTGTGNRARANRTLQALVKAHTPGAPNEAAGEIERLLGVPVDPDIGRESPFAIVDAEDLRLGIDSGLLEFGAHTVSHPILSALDDDALRREVEDSLQMVASLVPEPSPCFD